VPFRVFEIEMMRDMVPRAVMLRRIARGKVFQRHPSQPVHRRPATRRDGGLRHAPDTIGAHRRRCERLWLFRIQEKTCYFRILAHSLGSQDMTEAGLVADVEKEGQIARAMDPIDAPIDAGIGQAI
jgi:hypothetical protein